MRRFCLVLFGFLSIHGPALAEPSADPMKSPMWDDLAAKYLTGAPVVFDDRVEVAAPPVVEDQAQFPIAADARALPRVEKLIVFADLSPIPHILTLTPIRAAPYVSFRMKVEQATAVRAAALSDGVWHVGSTYLVAMGGGCSAPAQARKDADWSRTVGDTRGRLWREPNGFTRARFRIRHPMDTGLAKDNTPAYFIEKVEIASASGEPLAALETFEPLSENPTLTLSLNLPAAESGVEIKARDNNGGVYRATIPASARGSLIRASAAEAP